MKIQGFSRKYSFVQDILCKTITLVPKVKFHLKSSLITMDFSEKMCCKNIKNIVVRASDGCHVLLV